MVGQGWPQLMHLRAPPLTHCPQPTNAAPKLQGMPGSEQHDKQGMLVSPAEPSVAQPATARPLDMLCHDVPMADDGAPQSKGDPSGSSGIALDSMDTSDVPAQSHPQIETPLLQSPDAVGGELVTEHEAHTQTSIMQKVTGRRTSLARSE